MIDPNPAASPEPAAARLRIVIAAAIFVALLVAAGYSRREPSPVPFSAPAAEFSAERARVILERLAGDGIPHPVGSPENGIVRDRLIRELDAVGLKPTVELGFACSPEASCANVQNIVARIQGTHHGPAIVLNAHYDSVPASPGAGDDLSACAALVEVARAMKAGWPPARDIVFLFDDGEEAGLLGAEAWVRRNDPKSVLAAVVLESRGSSGRAFMFETSQGNSDLVDLYARNVPSPAATSLSFAIYQLLPNDTNFTVFKRAGMRGMAIAAIGDPAQYHTPANNVKNVSAGTIQHYGDTALALARRLAGLDTAAHSNSSYFDLLGLFMLRWPESWNLAFAIVAALLVLAGLLGAIRRGEASVRGTAIGFGVALLALAVAALAGWVIVAVAGFRILGTQWPASGVWLEATGWSLAIVSVALFAHVVRRRVTPADGWNAFGLIWSIAAIAVAIALPGGAYCIFAPLLVSALVATLGGRRGRIAAPFVAVGVSALVLSGVAIDLPLAMGISILPAASLLVGMIALCCLPLLVAGDAARRSASLALVLAVASTVGFFLTPVWTPAAPRPMSLVQFDTDGSTAARLLALDVTSKSVAPPLPGSWKREAIPALSVGRRTVTPVWWSPVKASGEPAPEVALENWAPQSDGRVRVTLRLKSTRGALVGQVRIDPALEPRVFGVGNFAFEKPVETGVVTDHSLGRDGVAVDFDFKPKSGATITLQDATAGLPDAARKIADSRSAAMTPAHRGDRLVVSRTVRLTPALQ